MKHITCCHHCTDRQVGCHGRCEKYTFQASEHRADVDAMNKENLNDYQVKKVMFTGLRKGRREHDY